MAAYKCPTCGVEQDLDKPVCIHAAGLKGGQKVKAKMLAKDPDYFRNIGKRGGKAITDAYGKGYFSQIGKKGGLESARRDPDHMRTIGRKGGAALRAKYPHEHFVAIGKKGGHKVARVMAQFREDERKRIAAELVNGKK